MAARFNTPPGWPVPPNGWVPPEGWRPDPSWPPAPPGWQFWIEGPVPVPIPVLPERTSHLPGAVAPAAALGASVSVGGPGSSRFGGKRRQLEEANDELRAALDRARGEVAGLRGDVDRKNAEIARLLGADPQQVELEARRLHERIADLHRQADEAQVAAVAAGAQAAAGRAGLVQVQEEAMLQEAGVYAYLHPLEDAVAYKSRLQSLQDQIKSMVRNDQAVLAAVGWTVNGSTREGATMVRDFSKLMLRAYNAEADNCVRSVRPHRLHALVDRLAKVRATIARLGKTMSIQIAEQYHLARVHELRLTADYLAKVEEEKERVRAERERQRDEERAQREIEREMARLAKERAHYETALAKAEQSGNAAAVADLSERLERVDDAIAGVRERATNTRTGWVYVISNIGAFGPDMVKIGMTRRLEPQDRIRELGDASVPFRFDTHALIFSQDAVGLETRLHTALVDRKVNKVNQQREFFYATPGEVRAVVERLAGEHLLEYHELAEASEWRQSGAAERVTPRPAVPA